MLAITASADVASSSAADDLVDALPYIDVGYDDEPDVRQSVLALVQGMRLSVRLARPSRVIHTRSHSLLQKR